MEKLTLIVPCYNEEEALPYFYEEVCKVAGELTNYEIELLFVKIGKRSI